MPATVPSRPLGKPISPRTTLSAAILIALTTVAVTACTSGNDNTASTRTSRTPDKAIPVVDWALPNAPASLDYAKSYDNNSTGAVMSLVTEPLERVSSTGEFTPNLATSVTQPDSTTLVYKLRSGV